MSSHTPPSSATREQRGPFTLITWEDRSGTKPRRCAQLEFMPSKRLVLDLTTPECDVDQARFTNFGRLLQVEISRLDRRVMRYNVWIDLATGLCYHHPDPAQAHAPAGRVEDLESIARDGVPPPEFDRAAPIRWITKQEWGMDGATLPPEPLSLDDDEVRELHRMQIIESIFTIKPPAEGDESDRVGRRRPLIDDDEDEEEDDDTLDDIDEDDDDFEDEGFDDDEAEEDEDDDDDEPSVEVDWAPAIIEISSNLKRVSADGTMRIFGDPIDDVRASLGNMRVVHLPSRRVLFTVRGTIWRTTGGFVPGTNQILVRFADKNDARWLRVKLDFDCKLYWEEDGTELGILGGVQAAPMLELQHRMIDEPGAIKKAERTEATGPMWPAWAVLGTGAPPEINEIEPESEAEVQQRESEESRDTSGDIVSPDGVYRVEFSESEIRMSHWVRSALVRHLPTRAVLVDLTGTLFDVTPTFMDEAGLLRLDLLKYPGDRPVISVMVDLLRKTYRRIGKDGSLSRSSAPLNTLAKEGGG